MQALITLINERLWVGHFDHWVTEGIVMFATPSSSRAVPKPQASSARRCLARRSIPANAISRPSSSWFWAAKPRVKRLTPRCSKHPGGNNGANGDIIVAMKRAKPADKPLRVLSGRLVLLGAGKMGSAMLEGWLARGLDPRKLVVLEPQPTKAINALARRGVAINPRKKIFEASAAVIAVKPQNAPEAMPSLKPFVGKSNPGAVDHGRPDCCLSAGRTSSGDGDRPRDAEHAAAIGRSITVACANPM